MAREWSPSWWGRTLTGSRDWRLRLDGSELTLTVEGRNHRLEVENEAGYQLQPGTFWTDFTAYPATAAAVKVDGLPNRAGNELRQSLEHALADKRLREAAALLNSELEDVRAWLSQVDAQEALAREQHRWFTHEGQQALLATRPQVDLAGMRLRLDQPGVRTRLKDVAAVERDVARWDQDWPRHWARFNETHTERELVACKDLFDRVESQPLTTEQARAVVCFDNRVQVVASAGSGKTSTMVGKAAYAIHRGFVAPERIVLLAFNKQAAEELRERAARSFARLGMEEVSVEASTFHALGLSIIGKATGEKPDIPDWAVDTAAGFRKLMELADDLKDRSPAFRSKWDLFRFVFGRDLPAFGSNGPADVWDAAGNAGMRTTRGEMVRSQEEVMIANWLFLNGVDYRYEAQYEFSTADKDHRQYKPDFYYPGISLYHEHFALDAHGRAPAHFNGYLEGVEWKRSLHAQNGTELFETTSHGLRSGEDFDRLASELTSRGLVLDPNPDRPIPNDGLRPMDTRELAALIRTFLSHAKSNCLTPAALYQRLEVQHDGASELRHRMFLDLAVPVMEAWDAALAAEGGIDFEDMLNLAAEHLEAGRYEAPYELVMADEFQDASRARARLCRALVKQPGRFFFAVGDDWQSINRFAGADVSVMTGFRDWFGHGQVLKLEQTFRCPQALCDVSSAFVSKNPAQIVKRVHSVAPTVGPVLQAFQVDHKDKLADAVDQFVMSLARGVEDGSIPPARNGKVSIYVLGRYNADRQYVPVQRGRFERFVDISFLTIHRSKGSEADYVILPEMLTVNRGRSFPSTRADDPVLALAMPGGDEFPLGEERRLFYVALTRARRGVAMFTARGQCSSFVRELEEDNAVVITDMDGKAVREEPCPVCQQGVIVLRTGPYGEFRACSNFPACRHKPERRRAASPITFVRSRPQPRPSLRA
ncbi:UvrD-helicase domain-containing protein [Novilysobacter defluvii]|uniref:DNA 3'-5' helicase n=1 Tax=Lysobacter defluvii IMMIB APB-9 = DSM 18482 TaxID=1385515 RepID=A0A0A0M7A7_9GAMM|nr:UvrD-helicase domain-containing protein [Lysobacter defluvii]KGO98878.1 helicase IV [Lysobacter defluvii IMMIB APB-9 = DSM 18482]